jgi:hypothetical protein
MNLRTLCALATLSLAACGSDAAGPVPETDEALLGDNDLDRASPIPIDESRSFLQAPGGATDIAVPDLAALPTRRSMRAGADPASLHRADLFEPEGKLAYVQSFEFGRFSRYWLRLATARDFQLPGQLIYHGSRPIDSVAVSEDGALVTFTAANEAGDLDAFLLDLGGVFGVEDEVYLLPSTGGDERDVSMSLDGETHAWQSFDAASGTSNYIVARLDRETGALSIQPFNISLGGLPIEQTQPSLSGNGGEVYFVNDDEVSQMFFGAPIIVRFASDGSSGAIAFAGVPGLTTELAFPSANFDGSRLLLREIFDGVTYLETIAPLAGEFAVLIENTDAEHPYLTADGASFTHAANGRIYKADIDFENPIATDPDPIIGLPFGSSSPFWARPLPPPPPPPEGTVVYDGTTIDGPTFDRPEGVSLPLVGPVAYHAFEFTTTDAGIWDFLSTQDYDGYLHLYAAPFDPTAPLTNLLAGNDDLGNNRTSGFKVLLDAGADYVLVTSAFAPGDSGNFTNTITPPQLPGPGEAPVIAQLTESLRVAAPGQAIDYGFFVATTDPIDCVVDYGDGSSDTLSPCPANAPVSVSHAFAADGFYTVSVTATAAGGSDTAEAFPTIHTDDPNSFDIVVVFGNGQMSSAQRAAFQDAADRWAQVIVGDLGSVDSGGPEIPADFSCAGEPGFNGHVDDLVISAVGEAIDGPGAILGSAGPCLVRAPGSNGALFPLPVYGAMRFDIADLDGLEADGSLQAVILHEMGHVLGIGTLWNVNGYLEGGQAQGGDPNDPNYDPRYIGPVGVDQFNVLLAAASQPSDTSVPAANTGGGGTLDSHWREATFFNELMTGFLGAGENPLSIQTAGSLEDLGYVIDLGGADAYTLPPASAVLFARPAARGHDVVWSIEDVKKK